jgi:hypothetical protein
MTPSRHNAANISRMSAPQFCSHNSASTRMGLACATLLAFATLIQVTVGAEPPALSPSAQREQAAAAKLSSLGIFVGYGRAIGDSWWSNSGVLPTEERHALSNHVVRVEAQIKSSGVVRRGTFSPKPIIDDAMLVNLLPLTELRSLRLWGTQITDSGLKQLAGLRKLRELILSGTWITDKGLPHLSGLTELRDLHLSGTKVTDAGLIHLAGLTNLEHLRLFTDRLKGPGLVHLTNMSKLRSLGLGGTLVDNQGISHIRALTTLTNLDVNHSRITGDGMIYLRGLTNLEWLAFTDAASDAGLQQIAGLTSLKMLHTGGSNVTDASLQFLLQLTNLDNLALHGTRVTDIGFAKLASLPKLTRFFQSPPKGR